MNIGDKIPEIIGVDQDGNTHTREQYSGKKLLLYFYPKDNTPGCTIEAQDFSRLRSDFDNLDIEIIGVSKDSEESHQKFREKQNLDISLIADENSEIHDEYSVIGEKKNYGKTIIGTIRSTFLIESKTGKIIQEWRNVRAK